MSSIRAKCTGLRLCAKSGRRHKAHEAIRSFNIQRRPSGSKRDMRDILCALRHYDKRFPHEAANTRRALWHAVRSLTPRFIPSPAFEKLYVDSVPCDLGAADASKYLSGKMSILHRLYHYGYAEAASALNTLRERCPGTSHTVPSGYPADAQAILCAVRGDNTGSIPASLQVLRAAAVVALVVAEDWHLENAWSFIQLWRPDLVHTFHLVAGFRAAPIQARAHPEE